MENKEFAKIKIQTPVTLIIHGANQLGFALSKTLAEQGSKVIIVDQYNSISKKYITDLKKIGDVDFIAFQGIEQLYKTINRIDYIYFMQYDLLKENNTFTSSDFLEESNHLNQTLKASNKFNSKFSLITTIDLNRRLAFQANTDYSTPSPYSCVEMQKYSETLVAEFHDKAKTNVRIIRLGTIIGKEFPLESNTVIAKLINDAVKNNTLTIVGEGLDTHYIINIEDVIYGILKLSFSDKTKGEVISLCNNNEYTTLSIAYKILELSPSNTEIKFEPDTEKRPILQSQYVPAPNAEKYDWVQSISLEKSIISLLEDTYQKFNKKWDNHPDKAKNDLKQVEEIRKAKEKEEYGEVRQVEVVKTPLGKTLEAIVLPFTTVIKIARKIKLPRLKVAIPTLVIIALLYFFLLGPIITVGVSTLLAYNEGKSAASDIVSLDFTQAATKFDNISVYANNSISSFQNIKWFFTLTNQAKFYDNASQLLYGAKYGSEGARDTVIALQPLASYLREFQPAVNFQSDLATTTREYRQQLLDLQNNGEKLIKSTSDLTFAVQLVSTVDTQAFPEFAQQSIIDLKQKTTEISTLIEPLQKVVIFMPELLGVDERQRYLVILQNPSELRSTGGWISSYAIVGIEGGQVRELAVDDVYNAEGILKSQGKTYEAPKSMQDALKLKNWSFSLSNWNPNFVDATKDMEFFIKETGKAYKINGVISIDVTFIQKLLDVWGGIDVPGEMDRITKDNLYEKIFQLHNDFVPGQSIKADFLKNLANEVLTKLLSSQQSDYTKISSVLMESLQNKDILVYLKNTEANKYLAAQSWNGVMDTTYTSAPVNIDWNWGGNKANLFLKKSINLKMDVLSEKQIQYNYVAAVQNNSTSTSYPEGDYKNLQRVYLPINAEVQSVKGFDENSYTITTEGNFKILTGWFTVPIKTIKNFEISYILTKDDALSLVYPIQLKSSDVVLDLKIFKQPGALNEKLKVEISFPDTWAVTKYEGFNKVANMLSIQADFNSDAKYEVTWSIK